MNFDGGRPTQTEGEAMVLRLQKGGHEMDRSLAASQIQLFKGSQPASGFGASENGTSLEAQGDEGLSDSMSGEASLWSLVKQS